MTDRIRIGHATGIEPSTLYKVLALRVDVFVVEQMCAYRELDGRDLEAGTRLLWVERDGAVLSTLRLLSEPDGSARVGRVATAATARGEGLARRLMDLALQVAADQPIVLHAQTSVASWYASFGFVSDGPEFIDDGIPHVPMRRNPI